MSTSESERQSKGKEVGGGEGGQGQGEVRDGGTVREKEGTSALPRLSLSFPANARPSHLLRMVRPAAILFGPQSEKCPLVRKEAPHPYTPHPFSTNFGGGVAHHAVSYY